MTGSPPKTRYAPSPTGPLHLGHARTHLVTHLMARRLGARVLMRIEDLDGPRVRPGAADQILRDHEWLGFTWDEGPVFQSARTSRYEAALDTLVARDLAYPCSCSRRDVELSTSAPHGDDGPVYPGTCRSGPTQPGRPTSMRFRFDAPEPFDDLFLGPTSATAAGDFVVRRADGAFAYQLAVVVDDADFGVTHVFRGADLVQSTPRQQALFRALGGSPPVYGHVPLVRGTDGERLAKRHGAIGLTALREAGVSRERLLGALGASLGCVPRGASASLEELEARFDPAAVATAGPIEALGG